MKELFVKNYRDEWCINLPTSQRDKIEIREEWDEIPSFLTKELAIEIQQEIISMETQFLEFHGYVGIEKKSYGINIDAYGIDVKAWGV